MSGPWLPLLGLESQDFLERLTIVLSRGGAQAVFTRRLPITGLRAMPLSFFPGWLLVEGEAQITPEKVGTFDVLYGPGFMWVIDGTSDVIHDLNSGRVPVISGKDSVSSDADVTAKPTFLAAPLAKLNMYDNGPDYLRFLCGAVWGDEGPFIFVESLDASVLQGIKSPNDDWRKKITPIRTLPGDDSFLAEATVAYGGHLYRSQFSVTGAVISMVDDARIPDVVLPKQENMSPFRNLRPGSQAAVSKDTR